MPLTGIEMPTVLAPHRARFSKGDRNKLQRFNTKAIIKQCNCRTPKEGQTAKSVRRAVHAESNVSPLDFAGIPLSGAWYASGRLDEGFGGEGFRKRASIQSIQAACKVL